jgi:SpoVK/Ycf46/Vps4 family AAA+-type ATPase
LNEVELQDVIDKTTGYSGSDMDGLIREAALGPIRNIKVDDLETMDIGHVRFVLKHNIIDRYHFKISLKQ